MKINYVTISREYGSGGREVGRKLADKLGIPLYDKEIIEQTAFKTGFGSGRSSGTCPTPARCSSDS